MITIAEIGMIALIALNLGVVLAVLLQRTGSRAAARPAADDVRTPEPALATAAADAPDDDALPEVLAALIRKVEIEESRDAARASTTRQRWQDLARGGEDLPGAAASCRSATTATRGTRGSRAWHVT